MADLAANSDQANPFVADPASGLMRSIHKLASLDSDTSNDDGTRSSDGGAATPATLSSSEAESAGRDEAALPESGDEEPTKEENSEKRTVVVLMSTPEGCEYDELDPPSDVAQHLQRGAASSSSSSSGSLAGRCDKIKVETVFLSPDGYARALVQVARRFERGEVDCVFNLVDGAWDEPSVGIEAVELLENKLNLPFTGAGVEFFEPTRLQMKKAALACGALVPPWRFLYSEADLDRFLLEFDPPPSVATGQDGDPMTAPAPPLCFPLLVKHFSSYASVGLTKDSKVGNVADLATQCSRMLRTYGGCLVEEFIEGREFTVLVAQECAQGQRRIDGNDKDGNAVADHEAELRVVAYDPVECHFGPGECFKHFNLKWVDYESIGWQGLSQQDPELSERLKATAVGVFRAMLGRGYARLDFRSDSTGQSVYFLEINPNCGILYPEGSYGSADFILDRHCPRTAHAEFVLNQIEVAKHLWSLKNARACEARYDSKSQSWGLYSTRNLKVGDLILDLEEKPMHLVSKSHVLRTWQTWDDGKSRLGSAEMRSWSNFCSYCWPVSDDLFAMWSPRPEDWQPINHSCDPNAWNEAPNGLNVVARTPIRSGEEIRMDYATFCGYFKEMKTFVCHCQAADCRGEITGMDILKPEVALKYEGHTTSYVASKAHQFHRRILDTIEPVA